MIQTLYLKKIYKFVTNLLQKRFIKDDIMFILSKYTEEWKSILTENFLERKIIQLKNKNKSKQYIKNKLIEQPEDREVVDKILNEIFWDSWDNDALYYEYNKLNNKNIDERKIIQRLLSKWFKYDEIKKLH